MTDQNLAGALFTESPQRKGWRLIWADRLAIAALIVFTGAIWLFGYGPCEMSVSQHLYGYPPGACGSFLPVLEAAAYLSLIVLVIGRVIDFLFTGRLRH